MVHRTVRIGKIDAWRSPSKQRLVAEGRNAYRLDGDNLRTGLNGDLGFSREDREEN